MKMFYALISLALVVSFVGGVTIGKIKERDTDYEQTEVILDLATKVRDYNKLIEREYGNVVEQLKTCSKENAKFIKEKR